ncbi:sugar ABC transporter substrate-binding protein [Aeromicrobium sp. P5_D10]
MSLFAPRRLPAALALVLGTSLVLSACASSSDSGSGSDKKFTIGISNPQGAQPILKLTQDTLTSAAKRDGIEIKALDAQLDPAKQVTDVDQLVAQKVDLIIVYPLDRNSLKPALKRASDAGIKIVGWAALTSRGSDLGLLSSNVETGGLRGSQQVGDFVKTQLGGKGKVLGVGLGAPVPALDLLMKQYQKTATEGSEISWLGRVDNATDDIAGGQKVVATALTKYQNDVQGIMAYNDSSAIGAAVAAKAAGLDELVIIGTNGDDDGIAAVKDGRIDATVDLVPWRTGLILETVSKALLEGKKVPTYVETTSVLYSKDNLVERVDWNDAAGKIADGSMTCADAGCPDDVAVLVK